jgi:hypothetical protein
MRHLRSLYDLFGLSGQVSYDNYAAWYADLRRVPQSNIRALPARTPKTDKAAENAAALKQARSGARSLIQVTAGRFGAELALGSPSMENDRR